MSNHHGRALALALVVALTGCAPTADGTKKGVSAEPSPSAAPPSPNETVASFPSAAFADISEDPVSEKTAAKFHAALRDMAGKGGMSATVMSP
jgi:hypothetical protein